MNAEQLVSSILFSRQVMLSAGDARTRAGVAQLLAKWIRHKLTHMKC